MHFCKATYITIPFSMLHVRLYFSSIDSNMPRSVRHNFLSLLNRSRQEGTQPGGRGRAEIAPTSLSSRDIASVPIKPPALRTPPPPQYIAAGPSGSGASQSAGHSTATRQYKRRIPRSPSPPVRPPIFTPLLEMGFSTSHIETAIAETGILFTFLCSKVWRYKWEILCFISNLF